MSFAAAAGLVVGVGTSVYEGIKQKNEASRLAGQNPYPIQDTPQAEKDNQGIARQMANEGLPSQQYALAMKNIDRSRTAAMRDAYDRRGGLGLIGQIQQNTNDAKARLDAQNANARIQNQRQLIGVNNRVAAYQQSNFNWNQKNLYNQNYNYSQQLQGAGNANIVHGIDSLGAGLIQGAARGLFAKNDYGVGALPSTGATVSANVVKNPYAPIDVGGSVGPAGTPGTLGQLNLTYPNNPYIPYPS